MTHGHDIGSMASDMRSPDGHALEQGAADGVLRSRDEATGQGGAGSAQGGRESGVGEVKFVVPGVPVPKGRPRFARRGNFVSTYTDDKTASYENLVKVKAEQAMRGLALFDGPVFVSVMLYVAPPTSWSQKKQRAALAGEVMPTSKPDIDNVVKGIFDAINDVVWRDDKQVVTLAVSKRYSERPCAVVRVAQLQEAAA